MESGLLAAAVIVVRARALPLFAVCTGNGLSYDGSDARCTHPSREPRGLSSDAATPHSRYRRRDARRIQPFTQRVTMS